MRLSQIDILNLMNIHLDLIIPKPRNIGLCSIDLTLGSSHIKNVGTIDESEYVGDLMILPGQFQLSHTQERVKIPLTHAGQLDGRSGFARQGLQIHLTACTVDPGFDGTLTLELYNASKNVITIHAGQPICALSLYQLLTPVDSGYKGPYMKLGGPGTSVL